MNTRFTAIGTAFRLAVLGLLTLSLAALVITIWTMNDFLHEQAIVQDLMKRLPADAQEQAEVLAGELRWQFRLSILVILNLVVTAIAVVLLWRAYHSSQESLRDVKAQASDILNSMDQGVITTDRNGVVMSMNRRGLVLLSLDQKALDRPLDEIEGEMPLEELRVTARANDSVQTTRDFAIQNNGSPRTFRAFCQPLRNHDSREIGNVLQVHDVTESVLIEERMRRMERYMGLGSLAAGLHHEIKNPLAALSLHVQLLEERLDDPATAPDVHEMFGIIQSEVTRIGAVLEAFTDFVSLGKLNSTDVNLADIANQQLRLIAPRLKAKPIHVHLELPSADSGLPAPWVYGDRVRLEQVLHNLLINSMEAMQNGGDLTVRIQHQLTTEPPSLCLEVADTGPGIPEDLWDRIFDPYFTTKNEGTGMGLALCDKIVRQHNGSLDFKTSAQGTTFRIVLPLNEPTGNHD